MNFDDQLIRYIDRTVMFYVRTAERLQRIAPWLESLEGGIDHLREVVCEDSLGLAAELEGRMESHVEGYVDEWAAVLDDPDKLGRFVSFINAPEAPDPTVQFEEREATGRLLDAPADLMVLTTAAGVRWWMQVCEEWGLADDLLELMGAVPLYSRGPKTTGAIRAAGLREHASAKSEASPELLEMLLRNAGRVMTRGQLIDRIWGADYVGDTKTLDVNVKRLRTKIEADPGRPQVLLTVPGLGYKFEG